MGLPAGERIGPDQNLIEAGLDSLMATELLMALESKVGRKLTSDSMFQAGTVRKLIHAATSTGGIIR